MFPAESLKTFTDAHGINWKAVNAFALISNGRAERMIGQIKRPLKKTTVASAEAWDDIIPWTIYGYRRRRMSQMSTSPYEPLYGVTPQMALEERFSFDEDSPDCHREVEALHPVTVINVSDKLM